jgi:hypothetical protein
MNSELEVLLDVVTRLEGAGNAYMLGVDALLRRCTDAGHES